MFNPWTKPEKREKNAPKRIPKVSKRRQSENTEYSKEREKYLFHNKACECGCGKLANQIHHKKGRVGNEKTPDGKIVPLIYDSRYFLAVCDDCHKEIELNPIWAKEKGYSLNRI